METTSLKLVSLAGGAEVFLDEAVGFSMPIPVGARPGRWPLLVDPATDRELQKLSGPLKLVAKGVHWGDPEGQGPDGRRETDFEWADLWLDDRDGSVDPNENSLVKWWLEDNRRFAAGLESQGFMNMQRVGNEFEDLVEAGNFSEFFRIPKFLTFKTTMRAAGSLKFARYDAEDEDAAIWTAFEGLQYMLTTFFDSKVALGPAEGSRALLNLTEKERARLPDGQIFKPKVVYRGDPAELDNGFPLQNFSLKGPWWRVVNSLLRLSHLGLVPNNKGEWVVFPLDPAAFPRPVGGYEGGGFNIGRDRSRHRSLTHRSVFRTRYEFRADFTDSIATRNQAFSTASVGPSLVLPIQVENVGVNPFDIEDPDNPGQTLERGTIQTLELLVRAWNAKASTVFPTSFVSQFGTLTFGMIKTYTLTPALAMWLTFDFRKGGLRNEKGAAIAATIYSFFRRCFRIPQGLRDHLYRIKPQMVEVRDTRTGKVAPSRVYFDHTLIMSWHGAFGPGGGDGTTGLVEVRPWPVGDAQKLLSAATPSEHATVRVFNEAQGVFIIKPLADIESMYSGVYFTTFSQLPAANIVGIDGVPTLIERATQDTEFRLSFLFSAELLGNNPRSTVIFEKPEDEYPVGGGGGVFEEAVSSVYAAAAWVDGQTTAEVDEVSGELQVKGHELRNRDILTSLARGLRLQHYFGQDDWVLGVFRAPGFDPAVDQATGAHDLSISHREGLFEAVYSAGQPFPPSIFEAISPEAAALLYRFDEELL